MKDKSLGIWLILIFGVSGLTVLALAWLLPTLQSDRIAATVTGLVGIGIALIRAITLKQSTDDQRVAVELELENKS